MKKLKQFCKSGGKFVGGRVEHCAWSFGMNDVGVVLSNLVVNSGPGFTSLNRFKKVLLLCLMFSILAITAFGVENFQVDGPSYTLASVPFDLNVSGLSESSEPLSVKVFADDMVIFEGKKTASELGALKVSIPDSGKTALRVVVEGKEETHRLRVIPGWFSILPPLVAIVLSLLTREVVVSLFVGVWVGAFLIDGSNIFIGFIRAIDKYLLEGLADSGHAAIVIFSISLGGMVGILNQTGGMQGVITLISRMVVGPKSAQLATWLMGVLIFFDDYANTLIVGNSMRPITDQNKVSREKLSYLVDSTSAPVAGIALISTWVGYEIGLIRQAFIDLNVPETNFYGVFLQTLPFRFYCVLSLFFGLMICLTKRDFGPMLAAEKRARLKGKVLGDNAKPISTPESAMPELPPEMPKRWYNAAIPIGSIIFGTMIGLVFDGGGFVAHFDSAAIHTRRVAGAMEFSVSSVQPDLRLMIGKKAGHEKVKIHFPPTTTFEDGMLNDPEKKGKIDGLESGTRLWIIVKPCTLTALEKLRAAFGDANSGSVLMWVSIFGGVLALLLGLTQGLISLDKGVSAWLSGARTMLLAMVVLLLAWSINGVCKDLHTAEYIISMVKDSISPWMVPAMTFIIACLISFATGTSWGTMAILLPISIPLAYHLNAEYYREFMVMQPGVEPMMDFIRRMMLVSIGAVLEGSIFGDHCSPISDTTIMSSMASGSDHIDHVRTQLPYALTVAGVSIIFCYIPAGMGYSPYSFILLGMGLLYGVLHLFGQEVPEVSPERTRSEVS